MRPIRELCAEVDHALTSVGMTMTNDGFVKRTHTGTLDGKGLRAELSVLVDTRTAPAQLTTGTATGYSLSIECDNGLGTRWLMGKEIPVLLAVGLTRVANVKEKAMLRADDTAWAARFLDPEAKPAFALLAEHATFIEQRPGVLHAQFRRFGRTDVPPLTPLLHAFATVSSVSLRAPAPRPVAARLTDNRPLVIALVAFGVVAMVSACGVLLAWLLN